MWLFWLFLALPIIEIALFIQVGGIIGLWPTLALVLLSGALGLTILRSQGARAMAEVQRSMSELRDPGRPMAHGALIMVAGVLLIFPGFFTDALGLLLLIAPVRDLIMQRIATRVTTSSRGHFRSESYRPPFADGVIDGEYVDEDQSRTHDSHNHPPSPDAPLPPPRRNNSGWTRH